MLERLLALFRRTPTSSKSKSASQSSKPLSDGFGDSLDRRLAGMRPEETILAGSLQLVGLDDVKLSLGALWDRVAGQVQRISQEEIRARLSERDVFRAYNGHTFLICFSGSDKASAEVTAAAISSAIRERIGAEIPIIAGRISVSATTAAVTSGELQDATDVAGRLLALLQQVRGDMQRTAAKQRSLMLQNSRVQFLPAISPSKSRIVFNTCALSAGFSFPSLSTFRAMAEPEQYAETLSQLDMMLLVSAVEALHHSSKQRGCCPVLVPVRLDSLRSHSFRDEYMKLLNAIPEKYGRFMLVEITGLSTAEDGLDVLFIAPELQRYVKRLLIEVGLEAAETLDPSELSVWGVSTSLAGWTSTDPRLPGRLRRYVQWAARKRLSTVGHGVNSLGLALQAQKAGFSAIDGPAVHPVATHPKPSFSVAPLDRAGTGISVPHRKEL